MLIVSRTRQPARQSGFSLVEVLIALVIMSVGMLGIAGLYVEGMKAGRTSTFRHHAVTLASDETVQKVTGAEVGFVRQREDASGWRLDMDDLVAAIRPNTRPLAGNRAPGRHHPDPARS